MRLDLRLARTSVAVFLFLSAGCSAHRSTLNAGLIDKGIYRNGYFGFALPIPQGAEIPSAAEAAEFSREGAKAVLGSKTDPELIADVAAATMNMLNFYLGSRRTAEDDSLFVAVAAVKLTPEMGIKDAADYIRKSVDLLREGPTRGEAKGPAYSVQVGGESFAAQDCEMTASGQRMRGTLHASLRRGHALVISTTYSNDAGRKRGQEILDTASF